MRHLKGNHVITEENAHEYADVTSIGRHADIYAPCPALSTIGGDTDISAPCPALISVEGRASILAPCPSLRYVQGREVVSPEEQREWRRRVAAHIAAHPEQFSMDDWHCGTTHCLAGTAQFLAGPEWSESAGVHPFTAGICLLDPEVAQMFWRTGETEAVRAEIMEWLK